jgi:hypothetical protein
VNCAAAGILLNVSRPRQPAERAVEDESDVESDEKQTVPQGRRSRRNRKPGEASIKVREGRAR